MMSKAATKANGGIAPYLNHRLVAGSYYFTLPRHVLDQVYPCFDQSRVDKQVWEMELAMSELSGDHRFVVGFYDGQPICFSLLLAPENVSLDDDTIRSMGWDRGKTHSALEEMEGPRIRIKHTQRAYAGWLMTNADFVKEHAAFLAIWASQMGRMGIPAMGPVMHGASASSIARKATGDEARYLEAVTVFLQRWRLAQLPAPGLPQSQGWQFPALLLPGHATDQYQIVAKPRHMPLLPADTLNQALADDTATKNDEKHLQEWLGFVSKSNTGKQVFDRYARLFSLQHFWRILHDRHGEACDGKKDALTKVFANFLDVQPETIRQDLLLVSKCLGHDWYRQV